MRSPVRRPPRLVLALVTACATASCDARGPDLQVELTFDSVELGADGVPVRGTATITMVSEVDQPLALDRIVVGSVAVYVDQFTSPLAVELVDPWPVEAHAGEPVSRTVRFEGELPAVCDGALLFVDAQVTVLDASGGAALGAAVVELGPAPPIAVEALPWAWTAPVELSPAHLPQASVIAPGRDAVWSLAASGAVLRTGPAGSTRVAALEATAIVVDVESDAAYVLVPTGVDDGATLSRLEADGTTTWSLPFTGVHSISLVTAVPDGVVVAGWAAAELTLGARTVGPGAPFVAQLDAATGIAVHVLPLLGDPTSWEGRPRPGGGFVSLLRGDPITAPVAFGLTAYDATLTVVGGTSGPVDGFAVGPDGTTHGHALGHLFALDPALRPNHEAGMRCADDPFATDAMHLAGLDDGGVLFADGSGVTRFDGSGAVTSAVALDVPLVLVQRGDAVIGAWSRPGGMRVGWLDVARLDEVLP